jgi:hypothetical protein
VYLKKAFSAFIHPFMDISNNMHTDMFGRRASSVSGGRDIATKQSGSDRRQREARQDPLSLLLPDKP